MCRNCLHRTECMGKAKTIARNLHISDNAPLFYELSQRSKTQEFYEKYKKRAKIEPKNAENETLSRNGSCPRVRVKKRIHTGETHRNSGKFKEDSQDGILFR